MNRLTTLLGKPILTKNGIQLGKVELLQLNRQLTTIKNIGFKGIEGWQFFPCSAIFAHDKDAIILKTATSIPYKNCISIPLGIAVYTVHGEYISKVIDFKIQDFTVLSAILENGEELPLNICIGITDNIIVDREGKEKKRLGCPTSTKRKKTAPKQAVQKKTATPASTPFTTAPYNTDSITEPPTQTKEEILTTTQQIDQQTTPPAIPANGQPQLEKANTAQVVIPAKMVYISDTHKMQIEKNSLEFTPMPINVVNGKTTQLKSLQEVYASQQFIRQSDKAVGSKVLTGKRITADLLDEAGKIIVEKHTVIAPEHIKRAIESNKLFQLIQLVQNY